MKKRIGLIFLLCLVVIGCRKQSAPQVDYGNIGDFKLTSVTTETNGIFNKKSLSGRVWIANFILTNCNGPCPILSANMEKLQAGMPTEVGFISFTVDPDSDDVPSLQRYVKRFSADPNRWIFVRGDKASLYELFENGFKVVAAEDKTLPLAEHFVHTTKFVLLDQNGAIKGYFDGDTPYGLTKLKRETLILLRGGVARDRNNA